ncbi:variable surface lipoprotein [Metamycoplasma canadense]|uniref:variable surface lipoprotein n=1 Tax=Metamycoplasma canadense TaxID=29554 RepID=UPI0005EF5F58|nr:variable surface lipoprotein [Metamycoplasma canadense]
MKKLKKILLTFGFLAPLTTLPVISAACDNKKEENSKDINEEINKIKKEYEDLQKKTNLLISSTSEKEKKEKDLQKLLDDNTKKIADLEKEINKLEEKERKTKKLEELKKLNNQYLGLADALKDGFAEYPELGEDKEDGSFNDSEEDELGTDSEDGSFTNDGQNIEKDRKTKKLEELKKLNDQYLGLADALKDGFAEYPELGEDKEDGSFNDSEEDELGTDSEDGSFTKDGQNIEKKKK